MLYITLWRKTTNEILSLQLLPEVVEVAGRLVRPKLVRLDLASYSPTNRLRSSQRDVGATRVIQETCRWSVQSVVEWYGLMLTTEPNTLAVAVKFLDAAIEDGHEGLLTLTRIELDESGQVGRRQVVVSSILACFPPPVNELV